MLLYTKFDELEQNKFQYKSTKATKATRYQYQRYLKYIVHLYDAIAPGSPTPTFLYSIGMHSEVWFS